MCSSNHAAAARWLSLVRERVTLHTRNHNFTHRYGEILAAGNRALAEILNAEPNADEAFICSAIDVAIRTAITNTILAERWLYLVAERVAWHTRKDNRCKKRNGEWEDWYEELLAAVNAELWRLLAKYPNASKAFLRTSLNNFLTDYRDCLLYVPPSTRRKRVARGDDPADICFDNCHFDPYPSPPCWNTWFEVVETYKTVYSLCESDSDQRLIEACWDDGDSYGHGPPHYSNIAERVGISAYKVRQRLDCLEAKYYRLMDRPLPTKRRQCRAPI